MRRHAAGFGLALILSVSACTPEATAPTAPETATTTATEEVAASPPRAPALPPAWHLVEVADATLGVPGAWAVVGIDPDDALCPNVTTGPTIFVVTTGSDPDGVCPDVGPITEAVVVARASAFDTTFLRDDLWEPAPGRSGVEAITDLARASYRLRDLDLVIVFHHLGFAAVDLPDRILDSVAGNDAVREEEDAPVGMLVLDEMPLPVDLAAPYQRLLAVPTANETHPFGDASSVLPPTGALLLTDDRVPNVGALVRPEQPLPLRRPLEAQDAPAGTTVDTEVGVLGGSSVAIYSRGVADGLAFDGTDSASPGNVFEVTATVTGPDRPSRFRDLAIVTEAVTDLELLVTAIPANPTLDPRPLPYVMLNRGTVAATFGLDHLLERRRADGTWEALNPEMIVPAIGFLLPPGTASEPLTTSAIDTDGTYRLAVTLLVDPPATGDDHDAPSDRVTVTRTFDVP